MNDYIFSGWILRKQGSNPQKTHDPGNRGPNIKASFKSLRWHGETNLEEGDTSGGARNETDRDAGIATFDIIIVRCFIVLSGELGGVLSHT